MNNKIKHTLWLFAPLAVWAQAEEASPVDIDLSDVAVVEEIEIPAEESDAALDSAPPVEVVEIPEDPIQGASVDSEVDAIPEITEALPSDAKIVLELPGQGNADPGQASLASEETISVDFPDEDVRTILRNVADLFELNLVIPDTLQGRTSIKLRNITWRQAFEVVLDPLGYTYVEDRNIIRIKSIEELTTEPVDTRVFIANYARAADLQGSIAPLVDGAAGGRIQVDNRSNALVITERPSRMNKIQEIIERLDKATDQVMIESKFIEVADTDVENLGVNWASLSEYSVSGGPFNRQYTSDNVTGITQRLDTAVFDADQFELILSALDTKNDVKLVSNPTVVTLNNTQAKIAIGERYPIPEYSFNADTGERQLSDIDYVDIGITLDVLPQVNSAGFINLTIIPEVSSSDEFATIENTEIPIIVSRRTETSIMVKDGYTLAIGGLVEDSTANRGTKVPVLGDLPGVGRLFTSKSDTIEKRNLVIFITAKTLDPDGSTYQDVIDPRTIDRMGLVKSDIPGYQPGAEEAALLDEVYNRRSEADLFETIAESRDVLDSINLKEKQEAVIAE